MQEHLTDAVDKRRLDVHRKKMNLGFEMLLDKDCPEQAAAIATGEYDPPTLRRARALLPPGGVALDIGSNVGVYACGLGVIALQNGGRVFAFEPVPNNAARLRENIDLNHLQPVVELGEFAFGREPGELVLHMPPEGWVNNAVGQNMMATWDLDHVRKHGWREFKAEVRRMDDWARATALDRCDLIKIDVEGAEMLVFEGGRELIERFRPVIIGEFSPYWMNQIGQSFQDVIGFFEPMGYQFFREFEWELRPLTPNLIATGSEVPNYYLFPSDKPQALETCLSVSR